MRRRGYEVRGWAPLFTLGLCGCMLAADKEAAMEPEPVEESVASADFGQAAGSAAPAKAEERKESRGRRAKKKIKLDALAIEGVLGGAEKGNMAPGSPAPEADDEAGGGEAAPTRAWFPETFLFEPAVLTDASGEAELELKVPDRLTTWRVLALAHSREGGQAGAVTTFRSSLPVYVDPVVPAFLFVGDEVEVPVQVVNTTDQAVRAPVRIEIDEDLADRVSGGGPVTVPASRSVVQPARIRARRPGTMRFLAGLQGKDAVERTIPIRATGRPVRFERGGTLGGERKVTFELPEELEPGATRLVLSVYPGALGLVRAELAAANFRQGVADDAYALLLAGRAPALLERLGAKDLDPKALRKMGLVASQRVIRAARRPEISQATLLVESALAHPDNPVLARLGSRVADQLAREQRPDGTFGGGSGWALRRVMVVTAEAVAALGAAAEDDAGRRRFEAARLRASGAFERYAARVDDAYTAAWAVASGVAQGSLRERFQKVVREAVTQASDGARRVEPPKGALRADARAPSVAECTALAALALLDDPEAKAWLPDLGATLMTSYRPAGGWGDGRANIAALRAVTEIFRAPLPETFRLRVRSGDEDLVDWKAGEGYADGPYATARGIEGPGGDLELTLVPDPPIPGMAYALTVETHVPWDDDAKTEGLELEVDVAADARVGAPMEVTLRALAPAGRDLVIRHALPAGVTVDSGSLSKLVFGGQVTLFTTEDGAVTLHLPKKGPGEAHSLTYRVIPTLRGRLFAGASKVDAGQATTWVPPSRWTIR